MKTRKLSDTFENHENTPQKKTSKNKRTNTKTHLNIVTTIKTDENSTTTTLNITDKYGF